MRRVAAIIIVFVILGAVVNVAIAWGCEQFGSIRLLDTTLIAKLRREQFDRADQNPSLGKPLWVKDAFRGPGTEIIRFSADGSQTEERRSGWPWRSVQCVVESRLDRSGGQSNWRRSIQAGILVSGNAYLSWDANPTMAMGLQAIEKVVPLQPRWPGFVLNTIFWALVMWLLCMIPRWIRSGVWIIRRRCMRCGYPVGTSPVCTECGRPISRLVRRPKNWLAASSLK